jgi:squalene synthase HpnC
MGRRRGENFPVASRVLPRHAREDLLAFYGFARLTDQLGDDYQGDRLAALDWLEGATRSALAGEEVGHVLVERAAAAVKRLAADPAPLFDLIEANRRDQVTSSYAGIDDLLAYCRLSADPVGRLVLAAFGAATPQNVAWSDRICTALQLTEHWQDVGEDARAGRIYLPVEDMERFGVAAAELHGTRSGTAMRALMAFEVSRARSLFEQGAPLARALGGRAGLAVAGFWAGGQAALDAIASADFDVLARTRRPKPHRLLVRLAAVLTASGGTAAGVAA